MKYFTIDELSYSQMAVRCGLKNIPDEAAVRRLTDLVEKVLDPAREQFGAPVIVSSGYRSPEVNRLVGGVARSYHLTGRAADLVTGSRDGNRRLFDILKRLPHCELIWENGGRWIHVAL
ncbi:MAG: DUF882 domain-containing protein [Muribaculaceae bacterium]|nr:DUF882 domain-containing protein [Muribaculaceae bacterium]